MLFRSEEFITLILLLIVSGAAGAGGIGGAFAVSPIITIILNYSINASVRLSYNVLLGSMIGIFILKCRERDPETQKPLVFYDLVLLCLPLLVLGSTFGVLLNTILPHIIIIILLMIVVLVSLRRVSVKLKSLAQEDKKKKLEQSQANTQASNQPPCPQNAVEGQPNQLNPGENKSRPEKNNSTQVHNDSQENNSQTTTTATIVENSLTERVDNPQANIERGDNSQAIHEVINERGDNPQATNPPPSVVDTSDNPVVPPTNEISLKLEKIYKKERRLCPLMTWIEIIILLAVMIVLALMRGTSSFESIVGLEYCSGGYWAVYMALIPVMVVFHFLGCYEALRADKEREKAGYPFGKHFRISRKIFNPLRFI